MDLHAHKAASLWLTYTAEWRKDATSTATAQAYYACYYAIRRAMRVLKCDRPTLDKAISAHVKVLRNGVPNV